MTRVYPQKLTVQWHFQHPGQRRAQLDRVLPSAEVLSLQHRGQLPQPAGLSSSCCSAEAEPAPISWDSTNVFMVYKHQTSDPQFEKITSRGFCCCIYTRFGNCSGIAALWYWQCRLPKYSHWERLNYRKARRGKDLVLPCTATTKKKFKSTLQSEGPAVLCNCIKPKSVSNSIALYHSQFQTTHNWLTIISVNAVGIMITILLSKE